MLPYIITVTFGIKSNTPSEYYNDISEADAKFYVMNRSLVDSCNGDTFEEKIDNAYKFLENDDEFMYSDESDDEY